MNTADFDYVLPPELIAQTPVEPRDVSRLLVAKRGGDKIEHRHFYDMVDYLREGDTLVINQTRVLPARLIGARPSGGAAEVLLLTRKNATDWEALVKPGRRLKPGACIVFSAELSATVLEETADGGRLVRFLFEGVFEEILDKLGQMPLPPYIHEQLEDKTRYQTVYAKVDGSAAAPTAGLHFTPALMARIEQKGVRIARVLLHVGLGTFRPVKVENIHEHHMHSEYWQIEEADAAIINQTRGRGGRIVCVGTTSVRTLETAADAQGIVRAGSGWTDIFIYPGYTFRAVDALITNFHLPQSTLLMLVAALMGREQMLEAYAAAVAESYRFFSFGDAMFIV